MDLPEKFETMIFCGARSNVIGVNCSYCSFIPESSRSLLTHGKVEEVRVILKRLAKWNGRVEPDLSLLDEVITKELDITKSKKKYNYLSLLKFKSTRLKILLCSFTCGKSYYLLFFNIKSVNIRNNFVTKLFYTNYR